MRKGPLTGRVVLVAVAMTCATTAAHAATTLVTADVTIVGNSATAPVQLTREGPTAPVTISIRANDGSIPADSCDGVRNAASAQDFTVGAGPSVSASGTTITSTFACDRNFASLPQTNAIAVMVSAASGAFLGNSSVPVPVGPTGSSSVVTVGDQLVKDPAFTAPNLHVRVNPRPPSNLRSLSGNGQIRLNWDHSPDGADITHYVVSRGSGLFQTIFVVPASQTSFTDTGLTNGATYCYRVRARYEDASKRRFQSVETSQLCASPVPYTLEGFFDPVGSETTFAATAGRAAPLKWRLLEGTTPIIDTEIGPGHWTLTTTVLSCETGAATATGPASSAGASGLQYDVVNSHYVFVWKTEKDWAGTCRRVTATYAGQSLSATFSFRG